MDEAEVDQTNLPENWQKFFEKSKPRTKKVEIKKTKYF